jgi:radical SAM superfamily enzyme YgiQ (UPF0313 family)
MQVLLVSTYEMGHQPLGLAAPAAALRARGHDVRCFDLAVESPESELFKRAALIGISVPMHTAARLGIALAGRVRRLNPDAHICFYGLYASELNDILVGGGVADSVAGGEYEIALCALADELAAGDLDGAAASSAMPPGMGPVPLFERQRYPLPDRSGLPSLDHYAKVETGDGTRLAGYVEASRGCAHRCTHCPITPVYQGRLRLVQPETVLADVDQLAEMGAEHITFGDPDFLNAVPHSMAIVDELHRRHPRITFDVTAKVEHLLEHAGVMPRLREAGCLFITSAFESCSDEVLGYLDKGHTRDEMERALALAERERLVIRPTWVAFTPWGTVEDFAELLQFVEDRGLVGHVQPVQYGLRLLLPPGSPLIPLLRDQGLLGEFDEQGLTYAWSNADPRIDPLQRELAAIVEAAAARCTCDEPAAEHRRHDLATFVEVKRATLAALGRAGEPVDVAPQPEGPVPRLTEDWFC